MARPCAGSSTGPARCPGIGGRPSRARGSAGENWPTPTTPSTRSSSWRRRRSTRPDPPDDWLVGPDLTVVTDLVAARKSAAGQLTAARTELAGIVGARAAEVD